MQQPTPVLELASRLRRLKRAGERLTARVLWHTRRRSSTVDPVVVTDEQIRRYEEDGCLLVSGLIPDEVTSRAAAAMWRALGVRPDQPAAWDAVDRRPRTLREPELVACYTDACLAAGAQLAGEDVSSFLPPSTAYTVNVFPTTGDWTWHEQHIDHALAEARHRTSPRPFRIATLAYLSDVEPHGGGTAVWPGSHRKVLALCRSDRRKYRYVARLNTEVSTLDLGPPVELTPARGDVLFYHPFCVHASSVNLSRSVRLAMNKKW